ncbi:MAG: NAD(P)(+) transhydrogenase (Re/Si-specific) subunit beta [Pseudomonadales bacterium]|nr:NAD(P)(+) transhydrogenase (Re/Si-specific) subunit beta [Pseudomonadales bacterium]
MSINVAAFFYLVASVLFILALRGLSSPTSARMGNIFGISGMVIAVLTTLSLAQMESLFVVLIAIAIGGGIGITMARRVEMTAMPELVAFIHSLVGLSAVLIAFSAVYDPGSYGISLTESNQLPISNSIELFIGTFIGAITFSGSVIAYGKLSGKLKSAALVFSGQHKLNLILAIIMVILGIQFTITGDWTPFILMTMIALLLGVLVIVPIGGADMPVVVSMLNSYSGWAAAGIGFSLNNNMLIIAGSLVGSSGAILSYVMCKAMNRSIINVLLGGFGGDQADTSATTSAGGEQKNHKSCGPADAAFMLTNADSVVIVPGYGMAVARAQHALKEMEELLGEEGVNVRYAIHPVAGRMPGHMNVLLAEAEVDYERVFEMEEINNELPSTDVVLVIGANDVVNPLANSDPSSPIYGMPIIEASRAKTVLIIKRSMSAGYAGIDNDLFYMDNSMMVFGDAKEVIENVIKAI